MEYFNNIRSLADLKKQYRALALANHPDRGGSTEAMQRINLELDQLYKVWERDTTASPTASGYEGDYGGATSKEYADYVHNEYRWTGSNYAGQSSREVVEIVRGWLKRTYPAYLFSVRRRDYNMIVIDLVRADFAAFRTESYFKAYKQVNHYYIENDKDLTDRAKEVITNVRMFVMSYNFDDSDYMTDYFCTNFYLNLGIGNSTHPYKVELPTLKSRKGDEAPQFRHPEGPAHKAIRRALGKARFALRDTHPHSKSMVLGQDSLGENGQEYFCPLYYTSAKTAQRRIEKLTASGIGCKLSCGFILFLGYDEKTELLLEKERQEATEALRAWNDKQQASSSTSQG